MPSKDSSKKLREAKEKAAREAGQEALVAAIPDAIKKLIDLMKDENPKIAIQAAESIIDRTLGKAKQQLPTDEQGNAVSPLALFEALMAAQTRVSAEIQALPEGGSYDENGTYIINQSINVERVPDAEVPDKADEEDTLGLDYDSTGVYSLGGEG